MFQTVPESGGYSGPKAGWVGFSRGPGTPHLGSDERGFLDEGEATGLVQKWSGDRSHGSREWMWVLVAEMESLGKVRW